MQELCFQLADTLLALSPAMAADTDTFLYSAFGLQQADLRSIQPVLLYFTERFAKSPESRLYFWQHIMPRCTEWLQDQLDWKLNDGGCHPYVGPYTVVFGESCDSMRIILLQIEQFDWV